MIWVHLAIVLAAILVGARLGGIGLGAFGALGLSVLIFGFASAPGPFPGEVLLIVLCVLTAAAALEASGGLALLVSVAERVLRGNPHRITFLAPLIAYALTFLCGTSHVVISVLPIIADVARKVKERPERPLSIAVIAAQAAVTASPLSAATVGMLAFLSRSSSFSLTDLLVICVPSTLIGVLAGAFSVRKMGVDLEEDPGYQSRLAQGEIPSGEESSGQSAIAQPGAISSIALFLGAALLITALGLFPDLRPSFQTGAGVERLSMVWSISLITLSATALILIISRAKPARVASSPVMRAGIVAVISILGIAWLGSTFFDANQAQILGAVAKYLQWYAWLFAFALFFLSILLYSQAATVAALMSVGLEVGIAPILLVAMFPATNGIFFFPTNAAVIAATQFDVTGTTAIGKWVVNHSFMRPGLVCTTVSVVTGFAIAKILY